mmetsp:Transcript_103240/g.289229  ORF Transcript_103240/g.289229 Transcript_103240/m.289229 type:complete len:140 (+) Transcript_103240:718-1137(+)
MERWRWICSPSRREAGDEDLDDCEATVSSPFIAERTERKERERRIWGPLRQDFGDMELARQVAASESNGEGAKPAAGSCVLWRRPGGLRGPSSPEVLHSEDTLVESGEQALWADLRTSTKSKESTSQQLPKLVVHGRSP